MATASTTSPRRPQLEQRDLLLICAIVCNPGGGRINLTAELRIGTLAWNSQYLKHIVASAY